LYELPYIICLAVCDFAAKCVQLGKKLYGVLNGLKIDTSKSWRKEKNIHRLLEQLGDYRHTPST